jgi:putative ABC transport system permease protein
MLTSVTFEALQLVLAGLVAGIALSVVVTRAMGALLVAVTAHDPAIYVSVALLVLLVGLIAALWPASSAMRVEPTEALRAP